MLLGYWTYQKLFPGDEQKIRKVLQTVSESLAFNASEGNIQKLAKVNTLTGCFTLDVTLDVNVPGGGSKSIEGRDELMQLVLAARSSLAGAQVEFLDVSVQLDPAQQSASAHLTAKATISGEKDFSVQELKILLKQTNHGWAISRVETIRTLGL